MGKTIAPEIIGFRRHTARELLGFLLLYIILVLVVEYISGRGLWLCFAKKNLLFKIFAGKALEPVAVFLKENVVYVPSFLTYLSRQSYIEDYVFLLPHIQFAIRGSFCCVLLRFSPLRSYPPL